MKTKINRLPALGLAIAAMVLSTLHVPAQPNLGITWSGNGPVLSWSTDASNCVLQSATNLAAPNWLGVSNAAWVVAGGNYNVTVTNLARSAFFRLYGANTTVSPAGMVLIPAGFFTLGDTLDGEGDATPTNIYVSAIYMDVNPVSYGQWQGVFNWATNHGYGFDYVGSGKETNHPVQTVNWYDCVKWCNARSQQAGSPPMYYTDAGCTQIYTNGDPNTVYVNWATNGYRLPTEAEWEKSARGGLSGQRFPWGDTISESQANYCANTAYSYDLGPSGFNPNFDTGGYPYTSPVGYFAPNGYGLYDMAGNVEEWCWDWLGAYGQPTGTNPTGPASGGVANARVLRGGFWWYGAGECTWYVRTACRNQSNPATAINDIGFRCVRGL